MILRESLYDIRRLSGLTEKVDLESKELKKKVKQWWAKWEPYSAAGQGGSLPYSAWDAYTDSGVMIDAWELGDFIDAYNKAKEENPDVTDPFELSEIATEEGFSPKSSQMSDELDALGVDWSDLRDILDIDTGEPSFSNKPDIKYPSNPYKVDTERYHKEREREEAERERQAADQRAQDVKGGKLPIKDDEMEEIPPHEVRAINQALGLGNHTDGLSPVLFSYKDQTLEIPGNFQSVNPKQLKKVIQKRILSKFTSARLQDIKLTSDGAMASFELPDDERFQ